MKIIVDQDKCIGCNMCGDISEGAMGTEFGKVGKGGQNPQAELTNPKTLANLKIAVEACPVQAISLEK